MRYETPSSGLCRSLPGDHRRVELERAKSLTVLAFEQVLEGIVEGSIPFGTLLSEKALAASFGTSKTPVREAFVQLQALKLVEILPQRGCLVLTPGIGEVRELCEFRLELEWMALRLSLDRAPERLAAELGAVLARMEGAPLRGGPESYHALDDRFHRAFFAASGNGLLEGAYLALSPRIQALRANLSTPNAAMVEASRREHAAILALATAGNREALRCELVRHIGRISDAYSRSIEAETAKGGA